MGLVQTEQSFRNAKANIASTSTYAAVNSDSDGNDFTNADTEEEEEEEEKEAKWVNTPYFPVEHVLEEYKTQDIRVMKSLWFKIQFTRSCPLQLWIL